MSYPYPELPRQEVEVFGIKTSYISAGQPDGPLVVLLHGMTNSGDAYRELMHEMADEFWLIAPDIPGFGRSDNTEPYTVPHLVEWLASFREALDLPQMMLVGHSFGGALAASYAIFYAEDVTRLLLVAPAILADELLPDFLKRLGISLGLVDLGSTLTQSPAIVERQSGRAIYDPDVIHESVWQRRLLSFSQSRASADVVKALAFQKMEPRLHQLQQPVCIVWGQEDPVLPAAQAERIAMALPDARVILWDQCGHLPFLEKQEKFTAAARSFLRGEEVYSLLTNSSRPYPIISVFGGSTPKQGSEAYQEAYDVGRLLAERGFAVATGGYSGTMTAVSQGAAEAGGYVIGVTSDQIEQFRPLKPNRWVQEEIRFQTLQERLIYLVRNNDGMIVLPGGIGTLSEMALAWSYLQVGEISPRPLALLGNHWHKMVSGFVDPIYVHPEHVHLLHFSEVPLEVVEHVANYFGDDLLS